VMQPNVRPVSVDGIRHGQPMFVRRSMAAQPAAPARQQPRPFQFAPAESSRPRRWDRFQLPLLVFGGVIVGYLVQSLIFGIAALVVYGICSLVFRIPSRATFTLAFMALVTVVVLLVVRSDAALAGNFATYTFLLLVIGVIALAIEARPPKRRKRPKRPKRG